MAHAPRFGRIDPGMLAEQHQAQRQKGATIARTRLLVPLACGGHADDEYELRGLYKEGKEYHCLLDDACTNKIVGHIGECYKRTVIGKTGKVRCRCVEKEGGADQRRLRELLSAESTTDPARGPVEGDDAGNAINIKLTIEWIFARCAHEAKIEQYMIRNTRRASVRRMRRYVMSGGEDPAVPWPKPVLDDTVEWCEYRQLFLKRLICNISEHVLGSGGVRNAKPALISSILASVSTAYDSLIRARIRTSVRKHRVNKATTLGDYAEFDATRPSLDSDESEPDDEEEGTESEDETKPDTKIKPEASYDEILATNAAKILRFWASHCSQCTRGRKRAEQAGDDADADADSVVPRKSRQLEHARLVAALQRNIANNTNRPFVTGILGLIQALHSLCELVIKCTDAVRVQHIQHQNERRKWTDRTGQRAISMDPANHRLKDCLVSERANLLIAEAVWFAVRIMRAVGSTFDIHASHALHMCAMTESQKALARVIADVMKLNVSNTLTGYTSQQQAQSGSGGVLDNKLNNLVFETVAFIVDRSEGDECEDHIDLDDVRPLVKKAIQKTAVFPALKHKKPRTVLEYALMRLFGDLTVATDQKGAKFTSERGRFRQALDEARQCTVKPQLAPDRAKCVRCDTRRAIVDGRRAFAGGEYPLPTMRLMLFDVRDENAVTEQLREIERSYVNLNVGDDAPKWFKRDIKQTYETKPALVSTGLDMHLSVATEVYMWMRAVKSAPTAVICLCKKRCDETGCAEWERRWNEEITFWYASRFGVSREPARSSLRSIGDIGALVASKAVDVDHNVQLVRDFLVKWYVIEQEPPAVPVKDEDGVKKEEGTDEPKKSKARKARKARKASPKNSKAKKSKGGSQGSGDSTDSTDSTDSSSGASSPSKKDIREEKKKKEAAEKAAKKKAKEDKKKGKESALSTKRTDKKTSRDNKKAAEEKERGEQKAAREKEKSDKAAETQRVQAESARKLAAARAQAADAATAEAAARAESAERLAAAKKKFDEDVKAAATAAAAALNAAKTAKATAAKAARIDLLVRPILIAQVRLAKRARQSDGRPVPYTKHVPQIGDVTALGNTLGTNLASQICSAMADYIQSRDDYLGLKRVLGDALEPMIMGAALSNKKMMVGLKEYGQDNREKNNVDLGEEAFQLAFAAAARVCRGEDPRVLDPKIMWIVAQRPRVPGDAIGVIEETAYNLSQLPADFSLQKAFFNRPEFARITESAFDFALTQSGDATGRVIHRTVRSPEMFAELAQDTRDKMDRACMELFVKLNSAAAAANTPIGIFKDALADTAKSNLGSMFPTAIWVIAHNTKMDKLRDKAAFLFCTRDETKRFLSLFGSDYLHKRSDSYNKSSTNQKEVTDRARVAASLVSLVSNEPEKTRRDHDIDAHNAMLLSQKNKDEARMGTESARKRKEDDARREAEKTKAIETAQQRQALDAAADRSLLTSRHTTSQVVDSDADSGEDVDLLDLLDEDDTGKAAPARAEESTSTNTANEIARDAAARIDGLVTPILMAQVMLADKARQPDGAPVPYTTTIAHRISGDTIKLGDALDALDVDSVTRICTALAGYIKSRDDYRKLKSVLGPALETRMYGLFDVTDESLRQYGMENLSKRSDHLGEEAFQIAIAAAASACGKRDTSSLDPTILWIVAHMRRDPVVIGTVNTDNDVIETAAFALSQRPGNFAKSLAFFDPTEFGRITESAFDGAVNYDAFAPQDHVRDATGRVIERMVTSPAMFDALSPDTQRSMDSSCMERLKAWDILATTTKNTIGIVKNPADVWETATKLDAMPRDAAANSGNFMYPTEIWVFANAYEDETALKAATNAVVEEETDESKQSRLLLASNLYKRASARNAFRGKAAFLFYTRAETMPYLPVFGSDYLYQTARYHAKRGAHREAVGEDQANLDAALIDSLHTNYTATMEAQNAAQKAADRATEDALLAVYRLLPPEITTRSAKGERAKNDTEMSDNEFFENELAELGALDPDGLGENANLLSFGRAARARMRISLYTDTD